MGGWFARHDAGSLHRETILLDMMVEQRTQDDE